MNERIEELAKMAGFDIYHWNEHELEKFAELIVCGCAEICYHHSWAAGGVDTAFGYGYKDCGDDIKQHFGVTE
jgi:hypothetical protein